MAESHSTLSWLTEILELRKGLSIYISIYIFRTKTSKSIVDFRIFFNYNASINIS